MSTALVPTAPRSLTTAPSYRGGRAVRYRAAAEPRVFGIIAIRTRYVYVGVSDAGTVMTPYRARIFRTNRYYATVHWLGLAAFVLAFGLAGFVLGVPR
jgi:hypothetical protein